MKGFLIMKKEEKKELNILDLLQENYKIETVQDISFALKDLFKDTLQQMMNIKIFKHYQLRLIM